MFHELSHPLLFCFVRGMEVEHSFSYIFPQIALKRPSPDLVDEIHRFSKSGPRGDERKRQSGERCATTRILGLIFVYQCNQCTSVRQGHNFNPIFLYFSVTISPNAFS